MRAVCPPLPDLDRFLAGGLSSSEEAAVEDHVEQCAGCQRNLAGLTADAALSGRLAAANCSDGIPDRVRRLAIDEYQCDAATAGHAGPTRTADGRPAESDLPRIPGYDVEALLGRGGLGVVYRALHRQLKRTVALKILRNQPACDERERLRREAAALAGLRHPNVVQIYDAGEYDGRPYLALEYVAGGTLGRYAGGRPMAPTDAARIVATLADAAAAAHRQGLVHRDLKPANVLVAGGPRAAGGDLPAGSPLPTAGCPLPVVKITDFGLVKDITGDSDLTHSRDLIGTPAYMAPEQAAGAADVGPACDVWALGAILYELLTGRPPFQGPTAVDTLMQVRFAEPVPPSRLQPKLPRGLETICLKCLNKASVGRYPSAAALADDLNRWLDGRPIVARPTPAVARVGRWCRRNPGAAAAGVLVAILAVAGPAVALREAGLRREAEVERQRAGRNLELAGQALDETIRQVYASIGFRPGILSDFDGNVARPTAPHLEELVVQHATSPEQLVRRARAMRQLAAITAEAGKASRALTLLDQCQIDLTSLTASDPDNLDFSRELGLCHLQRGKVLFATQRPLEEIEPSLRAAVRLLDSVAEVRPDVTTAREELADSLFTLGQLLSKSGSRWADAKDLLTRCVALRRKLAEGGSAVHANMLQESFTTMTLGTLLADHGDAAAVDVLRRAVEVQERLAAMKTDDAQVVYVLALAKEMYAICLFKQQHHAAAAEQLNGAVAIFDRLVALFGRSANLGRPAAQAHGVSAWIASERQDWTRSLSHSTTAVAILEQLAAVHPKDLGVRADLVGALSRHGEALCRCGRPAEAAARFQAALELGTPLATTATGDTVRRPLAEAHLGLGELSATDGDAAAALSRFDQSIALFQAAPHHRGIPRYLARAHAGRAKALEALGRPEEARLARQTSAQVSGLVSSRHGDGP